MRQKKALIQSVVSFLFSFLLSLLLIILFLSIAGIGVFDSKSISRMMNESNYYHKVYESMNKTNEALLEETGLPVTIQSEVITLERVYIAGQNYAQAVLKQGDASVNTDTVREELSARINQYLNDQRVERTVELDQNIDQVITIMETNYKNGIELPFLKYFVEYGVRFYNIVRIILPILIVIIGVLCYFLIRIQKYRHRGVRSITYSLLSSSVLTMFTAGYLLLTKRYEIYHISPEYYKEFILSWVSWDITMLLYIAGFGLTIVIVLCSLISYMKNNLK